MFVRELGRTGITVSEVGLGGNRLGSEGQPDLYWIALIQRAVDLGVTLFDTAERYANRRSEEMIGRALGNRDDVVIATKISHFDEMPEKNYSAARMQQAVEGSLRRLRRDVIDIYQLHSPSRADMERFDWIEGMVRLKDQGKIRLAAVAVNNAADGIWVIEQGVVEVLQITYNLFITEAELRLFDLALERGVGLMVRMPLARGVLTGKFHAGEPVPDGHRALLDGERLNERIRRVEDLRALGSRYPGGMTRLAHHFALTPRAVSAIIPGARTVAQLEENVAASNGVGLVGSPEVRAELDRIRTGWEA